MSSKNRARKLAAAAPASPVKPDLWDKLGRERVIFAAFALAVLLFYCRPLFDSGASIQWDAVDVHYSAQKYFAAEALSGRLPFWTPYEFSGFPLLADPQTGAWYPLNWPFFLMGVTPRTIQWELALHCLLALLGGYLLARELLTGHVAAAFAGVFFAFSGFFAGHSSHVGMFQAASLLPLLLWAGLGAVRSLRRLPLLMAVAGCEVLAGHFQTALYSFFALALFLAADFALRRESWRRTALVLVSTAVAAFALSAVMVLPGLELTGQSERAAANYSRSTEGELGAGGLATLVSPDHLGAPDGPDRYTGPADITQHFLYQGLLLLPLAVWGAVAWGRRWLALALAIPAAWYAFGRPLGLYSLVALLPGFRSVRAPVHIWFVAALGLALLGAAGVAALRERIRSPWVPAALLLVMGIDLYYWNMDHNELTYTRASFQGQYGSAEDRFQAVAEPVTHDPLHRLYAPFDSPGFGPLNGALDYRVQVTYGYNPLALMRYSAYLEAAQANIRLLDGLAVTARLDMKSGRFEPDSGTLPRVYAPERATPVRGWAEAAARLVTLDPASETVVEGLAAPIASGGGAQARILDCEPTLYRVHYQAERPTLLRVAVPYFPGWHAEVDGQPASVLPADLALMGIPVPAGSHELTLRYRSTWFATGAAISLLSWLALLVGQAVSLRRSVSPPGERSSPALGGESAS